MATKADKELAYNAGRQAFAEPPERRSIDACPFSPLDHPEERASWLQGFEDALNDEPARDDLRKQLAAAKKEVSS